LPATRSDIAWRRPVFNVSEYTIAMYHPNVLRRVCTNTEPLALSIR
jgi:hypothetical protein